MSILHRKRESCLDTYQEYLSRPLGHGLLHENNINQSSKIICIQRVGRSSYIVPIHLHGFEMDKEDPLQYDYAKII